MLGPFIDTVVICTMTALVIVITGAWEPSSGAEYAKHIESNNGAALTSLAVDAQIPGFRYVMAVAVVLFAFSTMISWSYYGLKGWTYLFGEGANGQMIYKLVFCVFVALGCIVQLGPILEISDALVFLICVPNSLALYFLAPVVKREMNSYLDRIKSGEIKKYSH